MNKSDFALLIFLLTVFIGGLIVQQELMHQRFSDNAGCDTEMHWIPIDKGFVAAVESECSHLSQAELRSLKTRHAVVDAVFYAANLLAIPLIFLSWCKLVELSRKP